MKPLDHNALGNAEVQAERYTNEEKVQAASVVYWHVQETPEEKGGLAGRAASGMKAKDLALGIGLGPLGILLSAATDKYQPPRCTCDVGIIAVGEHRVFLLKFGRVPMLGRSAVEAQLPAALLASMPPSATPNKIISFRPLGVTTQHSELSVHVLGKSPVTVDVAFTQGGGCLVVRAPDSQAASRVASAIRRFARHPLPDEAMASILAAKGSRLDTSIERSFEEPDYAKSFIRAYQLQREEIRFALILAARSGPELLRSMLVQCVASHGRRGVNLLVSTGLGVLIFGGGILAAAMGVRDFASGAIPAPDMGGLIVGFATLLPVFVCFGFWLLFGTWWIAIRGRRLEHRLFEKGGGFGGDLDAFLALVVLAKDWETTVDGRAVEAALAPNCKFAQRTCVILRSLKEEKRRELLITAPPSLREALIRAMLSWRGVFPRSVMIGYFGVWLPCLALGIYGAARGFGPGPHSTADLLVFVFGILFGLGGGVPAIVLTAIQTIGAWRTRRWARTFVKESPGNLTASRTTQN
jgi:hypothetical protein